MELINFFLNHLNKILEYIEFFALQGLLGAISGLVLFCISIVTYKFLTHQKSFQDFKVPDELKDFGDPIEARINISRSLIEMNRNEEAIKNLKDVLEKKDSSSDQKKVAEELLNKVNAT